MSEYTHTLGERITTLDAVDVLVAGGGPAGIGAAIAAARQGLNTMLLEVTGCLGGVSTSGNLPFWLGYYNGSIPFRWMLQRNLAYRDLPRPRRAVGGIFEEAWKRIAAAGGGDAPCHMGQTDKYPGLDRLGCHDEFTFDEEIGKRVLDEMAVEAGVQLRFYARAIDVKRRGDVVEGVYFADKSGIQYVPAKVVIDCTGDADLVDAAGFATYKGDRKTGEMTGAGLVAHIEGIDAGAIEAYLNAGNDPWFYDICAKARQAHPELDLPEHLIIFPMVQRGVFMVNGGTSFRGFDGTNGKDMTALTLKGRQRARDLTEYVFREFMPGAQNCRLRSTAAYPGVRETRRIIAEYILEEDDLLRGATFEDTIALAGRHFDLNRKDGQVFADKGLSVRRGITEIPFRTMLPKGADNLIVAGRCIGADGQCLGPARIMSTCFAVGEAAGTAARFKLQENTAFRNIDVQALRAELRKNNCEVDA